MDKVSPKVAVSVWGRLHAFQLAQTLVERQALAQLLTSYPRFFAKRFGIPPQLVSSFVLLEASSRLWNRLPFQFPINPQLFFAERYDHWAARHLREGAEILVAWAGVSLETIRRAKRLGMVTVVERGSAHIQVQTELLREEFARFGLRFALTHPGVIERELLEYEESDYIAIPSRFVRRSFLERGVSEKKLIQVPYGVDLHSFYPLPREDRKFRVVFCGALSLQKGIPYLLQAFHELNLPEAELSLVGTVLPEVEPLLARFQHPGLRVHGPKKQSELKWYFSQADLFCLPSIQDGFGMVLSQAMACGLPVLSTTNTGGEELVDDGREGFIIPIRDVTALKEKILWCYENREACRRMGDAARRRAAREGAWAHYGAQVYAEYTRAFAERAAKAPAMRRVG